MQKGIHAFPPLALLDDRKTRRQLAAKFECFFVRRTAVVWDQFLLISREGYVESCIYRFEDVANANSFITLHVDVPLERTPLKVDGHLDQPLVCGRLIKVGIRQACPLDSVSRALPELDVAGLESNIKMKKSLRSDWIVRKELPVKLQCGTLHGTFIDCKIR